MHFPPTFFASILLGKSLISRNTISIEMKTHTQQVHEQLFWEYGDLTVKQCFHARKTAIAQP